MSEDRLVPLSAESETEKSARVRRSFEGSQTTGTAVRRGPLGVGQMLDLALEVYLRNIFRYVLVAAIVLIPERIAQIYFGEHIFAEKMATGDPDELVANFVLYFVPIWFAYLLNFISLALIARMAYADLTGRSESVWEGLAFILKRSPQYFVVLVGVTFANMLGTLACFVGVIFTMWRLYLVQYVFLLEEATIGESFRRGWDLARGSFWRCVGLTVVTYILVSPWGSAASMPYSSLARGAMIEFMALPVPIFDALFVLLTAVLLGVGVGYAAVLSVVYYTDQTARLEGLDLNLALEELESKSAGGEAEPAT